VLSILAGDCLRPKICSEIVTMRPPAEESLDEAPDSPPQVPMHFMNGHRGWHIVFENGQEIIELVTSDEEMDSDEEGEGNVVEVPDPVAEVPDPIAAFWDIEMGPVVDVIVDPLGGVSESSDSDDSDAEMEVEEGGSKDIGIQCDLGLGGVHGEDDSEEDSGSESVGSDESDQSSESDAEEERQKANSPPASVFVCGGRGRHCVRGAAAAPRYICGGRGRHCIRGGPSVSRGRIYTSFHYHHK